VPFPKIRTASPLIPALGLAIAATVTSASAGVPDIIAGPIEIPGSIHRYYLLSPCTVTEAESVAASLDGRLAAFDTITERNAVLEVFGAWDGAARYSWIGLSDVREEGDWRWSTGESRQYEAWNPGSPRDDANRNHAYITPNGLWVDADGSFPFDDETPLHAIVEVGDVDCNLNLYPDWLDILDGESLDEDGDGVPDECQSVDCDGDGTADLVQLVSQPWLDCNDDGVLDACAVLEDPALDCNSNGIDDRCETPDSIGFVAQYYTDRTFTVPITSRIEQQVHFDLQTGEPWPGAGFSDFAGRWTGELIAPYTGFYTFHSRNDDGFRLIIDGTTVIEDWAMHPPIENSGGLFLAAGRHTFLMEWFDSGGIAVCELEWKPPFGAREIMPGSVMRPFIDCNDDGELDGCQIAAAPEIDCNDNGVLDDCESPTDCDGDGIYDWCELDGNDCNGNGVPDDCEIAAGSPDCQLDGIPDDCQAGDLVVLKNDDGGPEYGVRSGEGHMAWLQHVVIEETNARATAIEVDFVNTEAGRQVRIGLWRDPNGDGNPDDAELVHLVNTQIQSAAPSTRDRIQMPQIELGPAGGSYFIGCLMATPDDGDFPAGLDATTPCVFGSWVIGASSPIDPNDLDGENVVEFNRLDRIGTGVWWSNWVLRLEIETAEGDCNFDGIPDICQIAEGLIPDLDGNGIADACEDCDGDGIVDGCELSCGGDCGSIWDGFCGTEVDCNGDGIPDSCQDASNGLPDCDGNGIPDACDDPALDCDGNGRIDLCEIDEGTGADCDGDGILDACQLGGHPGYAADNDLVSDTLGWVGGGGTWWAVQYEVARGGGTIDHIEIAFGDPGVGAIATLALMADPDQDRAPHDMVPIAMIDRPIIETNAPGDSPPRTTRFDFDPIDLGPPGTSFFVAAYVYVVDGRLPSAYDGTGFEGRSWIGRGASLEQRTATYSLGGLEVAGEWIMRAGRTGEPPLHDCNRNRQLDVCDILQGTSLDQDLDGRPDECAPICLGDFDGDGVVGGADLGVFLLEWNNASSAADLNGDGTVDGMDFGVFLTAWGACG